jgi:hypothetical protein
MPAHSTALNRDPNKPLQTLTPQYGQKVDSVVKQAYQGDLIVRPDADAWLPPLHFGRIVAI